MSTTIEKISIALPPEMVAQVRSAVDAGDYASSSEVIRDALRDWSHKRQLQQNDISELQELWRQAREDKTPSVPADEVMNELLQKYKARARVADKSK
jgi:antitoxin ParD1/3/4